MVGNSSSVSGEYVFYVQPNPLFSVTVRFVLGDGDVLKFIRCVCDVQPCVSETNVSASTSKAETRENVLSLCVVENFNKIGKVRAFYLRIPYLEYCLKKFDTTRSKLGIRIAFVTKLVFQLKENID